MNKDILNNYIQYYITVFNDKSKFQEFINLFNKHSKLIYNILEYKEQNLIIFLTEFYKYKIDIVNLQTSFMLNGDRRANILLSYTLIDSTNNTKNISQYIQLAYSNKEYWIHSSLININ